MLPIRLLIGQGLVPLCWLPAGNLAFPALSLGWKHLSCPHLILYSPDSTQFCTSCCLVFPKFLCYFPPALRCAITPALCASLSTATSDNSLQHYFTAFAALMSPPPPSLQFPFPLGFASWFLLLLLLKSYFKPFLSFQLLDLLFLLLSHGSFLVFVCPPGP